jgi:tetratricopeptide (TPR) repeat protein
MRGAARAPAVVSLAALLCLTLGCRAARRATVEQEVAHAGRLYDQGDYAGAAAGYERAARLDPGSLPAQIGLGSSLLALERHDEARQAYAAAARLHPEDPWPYYGLGQVETATGRTEEALAAYREFARIQPGDANAQGRIGRALHALGRFPEAVLAFERAEAIDPRYFTCGCRPTEHGLFEDARRRASSSPAPAGSTH